MKLVCACTGDEDVGDYNYALISMPLAYVEWLLERLRVSKTVAADEDDFYAIEYFDHQVDYYDDPGVDFEVESGQFYEVPDVFVPTREPQRTAALTVAVTDNSIVWKGNPKHSSGEFETATMIETFLCELRDRATAATP